MVSGPILVIAVCGLGDQAQELAAVIAETASGLLDRSGDTPPVSIRVLDEEPTEATAAAHHLVVAARAEQTDWSDVSVTSKSEAQTLASDRLVPWVINWQPSRRAPRARTAVLAEPDPSWTPTAARLVARLHAHTSELPVLRIDHIGSTSVSGLRAKNLIDIQITVPTDADTSVVAEAATGAGFVHVAGHWSGKDRNGDLHPEQVCVDADPGRPVNVNIRAADRPVARDALLFRDWLRANPTGRERYVAIKSELAGRHVDDYSEGKELFISAALEDAETWSSRTGWAH